jgi:hypothetical protein
LTSVCSSSSSGLPFIISLCCMGSVYWEYQDSTGPLFKIIAKYSQNTGIRHIALISPEGFDACKTLHQLRFYS